METYSPRLKILRTHFSDIMTGLPMQCLVPVDINVKVIRKPKATSKQQNECGAQKLGDVGGR